jgi:DNA-damage-inducible protein D
MKKEILVDLKNNFDPYSQKTENDLEFWFARDLQKLLGYDKWQNFSGVIEKAKIACGNAGYKTADHFTDISKMITVGKGAQMEIDDIALTRFACYLIAQNGDPTKEQIAFAQAYFATQTKKMEVLENIIEISERINARKKLSLTEKRKAIGRY